MVVHTSLPQFSPFLRPLVLIYQIVLSFRKHNNNIIDLHVLAMPTFTRRYFPYVRALVYNQFTRWHQYVARKHRNNTILQRLNPWDHRVTNTLEDHQGFRVDMVVLLARGTARPCL